MIPSTVVLENVHLCLFSEYLLYCPQEAICLTLPPCMPTRRIPGGCTLTRVAEFPPVRDIRSFGIGGGPSLTVSKRDIQDGSGWVNSARSHCNVSITVAIETLCGREMATTSRGSLSLLSCAYIDNKEWTLLGARKYVYSTTMHLISYT
jgi:hypothetical protein